MKKYCTKCGHEFEAVGREVICPSCKAHAAEDAKRAAVLCAKRKSWTGESVPVRISGRASTVIRGFGASHTMTFAEALDALLRTTDYFLDLDKAWEDITPYKSRRRDKHATEDEQEVKTASKPQDKPQAASKPQDVQTAHDVSHDVSHDVKQAARAASKASASKAASKASASKAASKASK